MFVCVECGELFEEPRQYKEKHGLDHEPYEIFYGCPYCSGSYTETYKCSCCGEWITNDYVKTDDGNRYCDNCYFQMNLCDE